MRSERLRRASARRGRHIHVPATPEGLEGRALLTGSFTAPDLSTLIAEAKHGQDTSIQAIDSMTGALQQQLTSGPLAQLQAGTIDPATFAADVQTMVADYQTTASDLMSAKAPHLEQMISLQGDRVATAVSSLAQKESVGLMTAADFQTGAAGAINELTTGSLRAVSSPLSGYAGASQQFESDLNAIAASLASGASPSLTPDQAATTITAEAAAYQAAVDGSLYLHPNVQSTVDGVVSSLESSLTGLSTMAATDAQTAIQSAVSTFDAAILGQTGLFGPSGPVAKATGQDRS